MGGGAPSGLPAWTATGQGTPSLPGSPTGLPKDDHPPRSDSGSALRSRLPDRARAIPWAAQSLGAFAMMSVDASQPGGRRGNRCAGSSPNERVRPGSPDLALRRRICGSRADPQAPRGPHSETRARCVGMSAGRTTRRPEGVVVRHSCRCASHLDAGCDCRPRHQAQASPDETQDALPAWASERALSALRQPASRPRRRSGMRYQESNHPGQPG